MTYIRPKSSKDRQNVYTKERRLKYKQNIFELLGDKCKSCGFSNPLALQIDHINGGGHKERKKWGGGLSYITYVYLQRINNPEKFLETYQLLCANCNTIKKFLNGEH